MHTRVFVFLAGMLRRAARFSILFISTLFVAAPALAQDMPAGGRTGSLLNILLLAFIAFFLVRSFRRRGGGDDKRPGRWTPTERDDDEDAPARSKPVDRHEAARRTWDVLGSKDPEQSAAATPTGQPEEPRADGFDDVEFLEGAKLFFTRFQQAREDGDFSAISEFISDDVFARAVDGERIRVEVMLLTARLVELKSEEGRTKATVFYDARLKTGERGDRDEHVRQVWEFSRDDDRPDALWILERTDNVDQ